MSARTDVVVVGAGHNGLVAATLLARAGLAVAVLRGGRRGRRGLPHRDAVPPGPRAQGLHRGLPARPDAARAARPARARPAAGAPRPALLHADAGRSAPAARRRPGRLPRPARGVLLRGRRPGRRGALRGAGDAARGPGAGLAARAAAAGGDRRSGTSARRCGTPSWRWCAAARWTTCSASASPARTWWRCTRSPTVSPAWPARRSRPARATTCWCTRCAGCPARAAPGWSSGAGWAR